MQKGMALVSACLALGVTVFVATGRSQESGGALFFEGARLIVGDGTTIVYLKGRALDRADLRAAWTTRSTQ